MADPAHLDANWKAVYEMNHNPEGSSGQWNSNDLLSFQQKVQCHLCNLWNGIITFVLLFLVDRFSDNLVFLLLLTSLLLIRLWHNLITLQLIKYFVFIAWWYFLDSSECTSIFRRSGIIFMTVFNWPMLWK